MTSTVNLSRQGRVAVVELSRPEAMNAVDPVMKKELPAVLSEVARDPEIGAVVLAAAGKAFCTGSDLKAGPGGNDDTLRRTARSLSYDYRPVFDLLTNMDKPVIAAVNGAAAGVGLSFALCCDLIAMSKNAFFMSPFLNVGLVPDGGTAWFLTRKLGHARGFEALVSGEKLSAEQCLSLGLANRVVDAETLRADALAWAEQLAAKAPTALALTKRLARLAQSATLGDFLNVEAELQAMCASSQDAKEAIAAFIEKRSPTFTGR